MLDLEKLGKMVDEALAKETKESLLKWLQERRENACKHEEFEVVKSGMYVDLCKCKDCGVEFRSNSPL